MNKSQIRIISTSTALGALMGFLIGLVITQGKKEQLRFIEVNQDQEILSPNLREWIGLTVAAVTLLRQLANIVAPKSN